MPEYKIIMPSKPRVVVEEGNKGVFEIERMVPDTINLTNSINFVTVI